MRGTGSKTFEALKAPAYRLLWFGGILSFFSVQMEFIARGWLAYDLMRTNTALGGVALGFGVPMLILTTIGGVAADRLSKRRVLLACQAALAASSLTVAIALSLDIASYGLLVATAVVQGAGFSFIGPARMAFTGDLVGTERLANAVVLQQASMNGSRIIGPSLAGALIGIAWFGVGGVYYMTTAFMLAAMAVTFRLPDGRPHEGRVLGTPFAELVDGVRYVARHRELRLLVTTSFVVIMFAFPFVTFLPTLVERHYGGGASGYGLLSGASAIGALAASLFIAARAGQAGAWRLQAVAGAGFGASVAVLGVLGSLSLALGVALVQGAMASAYQGLNNSLVLQTSEQAYHGRVQSFMMLSFSGFGLAALPLGALADAIGLPITMILMGSMAVAAMAVYATARWRAENRAPDQPPTSEMSVRPAG